MFKNLISSSLFLLVLLVLSGCETDHYLTMNVNNQSSETIVLRFHNAPDLPDSLALAPGEEKEVYSFYKRGAQPEGMECRLLADSVSSSTSGGKSLAKDMLDDSQWDSQVEGKRTVTQVCTFTITDADLQ